MTQRAIAFVGVFMRVHPCVAGRMHGNVVVWPAKGWSRNMADGAGVDCASMPLQQNCLDIVVCLNGWSDRVRAAMAARTIYALMTLGIPIQNPCAFTVGGAVTRGTAWLIQPGPSGCRSDIGQRAVAVVTGEPFLKHAVAQTFGLRTRVAEVTGAGHGAIVNPSPGMSAMDRTRQI